MDLNKFILPDNFRGRSAFIVQLWWVVQATLFRGSPQFLYSWRSFLLRLFGATIGKNVRIRPSATITYPWKVAIGDNSWIGDHVTLYSLGDIQVGINTVISQHSYICAASHDYRSEAFEIYSEPVYIGDRVWIATDVFIAPGITIGNACVIGARSTVLGDIPSNSIAYGYPARIVRENNTSTVQCRSYAVE